MRPWPPRRTTSRHTTIAGWHWRGWGAKTNPRRNWRQRRNCPRSKTRKRARAISSVCRRAGEAEDIFACVLRGAGKPAFHGVGVDNAGLLKLQGATTEHREVRDALDVVACGQFGEALGVDLEDDGLAG